jgi:nicotinate phosphoribosyltransferase
MTDSFAGDSALLTDLYELRMLQAYREEGLTDTAVFTLSVRRLPDRRNFLLACGLDSVLEYLERLRFTPDDLAYLESIGSFSRHFLDSLADFRFTGDVHAMPEGTPVFHDEPILEIEAPLPEAQLVETFVMNQMHVQTVIASKAARVVLAARGRTVVDFGARRTHGIDAANKAARASYIAGVASTSNVLAGKQYGIPVAGTMAHSYVQAHAVESDAFRAFARLYPGTILLVDTYDTLAAVQKVIDLHRMDPSFRISAVRLDSGDLAQLAVDTRRLLDAAGLTAIEIFASSGLDEDAIATLVAADAPIDGFGVGTAMGASSDAPVLDMVYKLCAYAGQGRVKLSTGKPVLPGRKQVFRFEKDGRASHDVIARASEQLDGRPLLRPMMRGGRRLPGASVTLDEPRRRAREELSRLPSSLLERGPAEPPYPVRTSDALAKYHAAVAAGISADPGHAATRRE